MKSSKGISLIALVITVIVILILAGVTIYNGLLVNGDRAIETKTTYEVYSVLDAIGNRTLLHQINPEYYEYVGDNNFGEEVIDGQTYSSSDGWYKLNSETGDFEKLGIDNVKGEYLINYEKGLAISVEGFMYEGVVYYSLNEMKKNVGGEYTMITNVEYDEDKKVNKPVLSVGMVPIKYSGGQWYVTSADDEGWYDYSLSQMAWANVMLRDELTVEGMDNQQVRQASLSQLVGKRVVTEGSSYVWIPRYSSNGTTIIFSHLTDDTLRDVNGTTYTVPNAFNYNGSKLPGIWVSKYEANLITGE